MKLKSRHKLPKWLVAATAAGLLAAPAAPALAADAQASFTNFSIQLIDLNFFDGVAPSLTWSLDSTWTSLGHASDTSPAVSWSDSRTGLFNGLASMSNGSAHSGATASVTYAGGAPLFTGSGLLTNGHAESPGAYFDASALAYGNFVLSPFTIAYFFANGAVSTAAAAGESASAQMAMTVWGSSGGAAQSSSATLHSPSSNSSASSPLFASFANLTNSPLGGYFQASASVSGVVPVPEAETYAMLLAGLGLVAGMARRRRSHAA